jgi:uncharacterized membrane protein YidH (DUF202 family)
VKGIGIVLTAFALLLLAINVPMPTIFHENRSPTLIAAASIAVCALTGIALWLGRGRAEDVDPDEERPVTEESLASAAIGVAVALILLGVKFGVFLVQIGGGLLVFGVAGVVREVREERRRAAR